MRLLALIAWLVVPFALMAQTVTHVRDGGAEQQFTNKAAHVYNVKESAAFDVNKGAYNTGQWGSSTNVTATNTNLGAAGTVVLHVEAISGTSPTIQFFDDEDGTCDENPRTAVRSLTVGTPQSVNVAFFNQVCANVGGTTPVIRVTKLP